MQQLLRSAKLLRAWHDSCGFALCLPAQLTWPMGSAAMKKKHLFPAIAVIALTIVPACAAELMPINLGISKLGAMTDVWVASKYGIFKKHGLDLQIDEIPLTSQSIRRLQSKSVDIVLQIPGTAMAAKEQGFDIVLVGQNETAGTTPPVSNALMVRANLSIASDQGTRRQADRHRFAARPKLRRAQGAVSTRGLSVDDVQLVAAPFTSHADLLTQARSTRLSRSIPIRRRSSRPGMVVAVLVHDRDDPRSARRRLVGAALVGASNTRSEIAAFQDAIKESHDLSQCRPGAGEAVRAEYTGLDPELVQAMPLISWKSTIDPKIWQEVTDMMQRQGELTSKHDVAEYLAK